jgi:vancomycin resistance protein YoaR
MAVSEEVLDQRRGIHVARPGVKFVAFVVAVLLGVGVVVGGLVAFHESLAGRILPGISAAGVDLGGLTPDEARAALTARYGALSQGGLLVRSDVGSTTIPFSAVGRGADIDSMLADAAARGRGGTWLDETVAAIRLRLEPASVPLAFTYDHALAASAVAAFADQVVLQPTDAIVRRTTTGFETVPSVDGHRLDAAATLAAVDAAMRDTSVVAGASVEAPSTSLPASLTTEQADLARAAAQAMVADLKVSAGKKTWTLYAGRIRTWIDFGWTNGAYGPVIDESQIPKMFTKIAPRVARPVVNAAFLKDRHGRIVGAMADSAGRKLDVDATTDRVVDALQARAAGTKSSSIKLALAAVLPARTTAEVAKSAPLMVKVGSWTTYWQVSPHNGMGANIIVPARRLNGTVVQPGQTFDFWQALGEVSFRTGYRLGGAIVGGHSVEGKALAGGICATSTTLFNAALRGGFEIDARQPHWYYITKYPLGLDATVSQSQTMRFTNDTPNAILIRGFASPGVVRFEIWSVPNGRTVSLSRPSVSNVVKGFDTSVKTAALPKGTSERTEWPVDGKDVVVTRTVRDANGRIIHHETYVSHYHRMIGINRIGIG